MNKNGFTLVELLAVIAVVALLIIITATSGFEIFNKAKRGINKIEEDNLIEAAKVFLVDVDNEFCSSDMSTTECSSRKTSCIVSKNSTGSITGTGCNVKVDYIIDNYMDKKPEGCNGDIELILKIEQILDVNGIVKEVNYLVEKPIDEDGSEVVICSN